MQAAVAGGLRPESCTYVTGGISRLRIPFDEKVAGVRRVLELDLVRINGIWKCVRLAF
jgi:hypothetical protein